MGQEPIRVLQVVSEMGPGGIETLLMNLYRNIDRSKIQFDFLAHYGGRYAAYNEEIRALGGMIYEMPKLKDEQHVYYWRLFAYIRALNNFFKEHRYDIIHGHMTNTASIYMPIARKYGVQCRISHSHNTHAKAGLQGMVTDALQKHIYRYATDMFACSKAAIEWFYPQDVIDAGKVIVFPNAVDGRRFRYNEERRREIRTELDLQDKTVIGCVGRFRPEKNQIFLVDVLQRALQIDPRAVLMFAGEGPCEESVKGRAAEMGLQDKVLFLGVRSDIPDILQAMDVFAMPSQWEGLPVVGVEAQASGLPMVVSDKVTEEMDLFGLVEYVSLDASAEAWADKLISASKRPRQDTYEMLQNAGYDIGAAAMWLQNFYLKKFSEIKR